MNDWSELDKKIKIAEEENQKRCNREKELLEEYISNKRRRELVSIFDLK